MFPATSLAMGQPGEAMASVLGKPALRGSERNAMMTGHVGQWHVVFDAGLEQAIALQCSRPLVGRQCRQRRDVLGLSVHRKLFMIHWRYQDFAEKISFSAKKCKLYNAMSRG
jgi:hypothetical protein